MTDNLVRYLKEPRIVHEFRYANKTFKAGELTVALFMMYADDPVYTMDYILSEFNEKKPRLTAKQYKRFLNILFGKKVSVEDAIRELIKPSILEKKIEKSKEFINDFHIWAFMVAKNTSTDVMNLPLRVFRKILADLQIITGSKEYDPKRNSKQVDRQALRRVTGGKKNFST